MNVDEIRKSGLFDEAWYLKTYPDVKRNPIEHYMKHGAKEGRNPSQNFDTRYYLKRYSDVAASGMNPLTHYIRHGQEEGRLVTDPVGELKTAAAKKRLQEIKSEFPKVLSTTETLEHLIKKRASISRFGDGEFSYCLGVPQYYQDMDEELRARLQEVLSAPYNEKCLVGITKPVSPDNLLSFSEDFYMKHFEELKPLLKGKTYGDACISRTNVFLENPLGKIKSLWRDRDVVFVYGKGGRFLVHEELFDNVNSYETIYTPATNAFSDYDDILNQCLSHSESKLFLLACGLTSTVLAYDLSRHGYQALDIGHLPNSYDAYRGRIHIAEEVPFEGNASQAPTLAFDRAYYTNRYPDVAKRGMNPFRHYIRHGKKEGRSACPVQVSIIIPHKNMAKSLSQLLKSIKEANASLAVYIVDDHSKSLELARLKQLEKDYPSYHFLTSKGHYAGVARNTALKWVTTKWVLFADADDTFLPGWYEEVSRYLETQNDLVLFPPTSKHLGTGKLGTQHLEFENIVKKYRLSPSKYEDQLRFQVHPIWSKLIQVEFIHKHGLVFGEEEVASEMLFALKAGFWAKKVSASSAAIYCVTEDVDTLRLNTLERLKVRGEVVRQCNDFLAKNVRGRGNYQLDGKPLYEAAVCAGLRKHEVEELLDYLRGLGLRL